MCGSRSPPRTRRSAPGSSGCPAACKRSSRSLLEVHMRNLLRAIAVAVALLFAAPAVTWAKTAPAASKKADKLDLNTASEDQLWEKKIIPKSTYQKIRDQVVAHQSK